MENKTKASVVPEDSGLVMSKMSPKAQVALMNLALALPKNKDSHTIRIICNHKDSLTLAQQGWLQSILKLNVQ